MSLIGNKDRFFRNAGKDFNRAFTSFNELSTSTPTSLFDLKSIYGFSEIRDSFESVGSGQISLDNGLLLLSTGEVEGSSAALVSIDRGRYVAGFDAVPGIAVGVPVLPVGSQVARWGYFNDLEGFGTGVDKDGFFTFLRAGGVETVHRREQWLDKVGKSLKETGVNIYRYPFRWYGGGPVRFEISGEDNPLHPDLIPYDAFMAQGTGALTSNPNLKIRAEVSGGGSFGIKVGGRQFLVKGSYNPLPRFSSEYRLGQSISTEFTPLISCRQKEGILSTVSTRLGSTDLLVASSPIIVQIRIGAVVAAPSSNARNIPEAESAMLWDNTAVAMSGGFKIYEALAPAVTGGNRFEIRSSELPPLALPDDKVITLCARAVSGTATVSSKFSIKEEW